MTQILVHVLRKVGQASARLRKAAPWLDRTLTVVLEGLFYAFSGRNTGTVSQDECRKEADSARDYHRQRATMSSEIARGLDGLRGICIDETGTGQFCSRVLDFSDLKNEMFLKRFHELKFSAADPHRKNWEKALVSLLVDHFGLAKDDTVCLGLGVGGEVLLFHFANCLGRVVGIDLYRSGVWDSAAFDGNEVYELSPFPYRRERLAIRQMDMRALDFEDDSFDFVWSISSIEHMRSIDEVVRVFRETERVLRPGGYAFITTEWNLVPANPRYVPGCIIFDEPLVNHVLRALKEMSLVGPIRTRQSDSPAHVYRSNWCSNTKTEIAPVCNIFTAGTFTTAVALVLRKHER